MAPPVRLFADLSIADGRFHHVAGISTEPTDGRDSSSTAYSEQRHRSTRSARLRRRWHRFGSTAAPTNNLSGTIDEIRISRVARATVPPGAGQTTTPIAACRSSGAGAAYSANVIAMINQAAPFRVTAPYSDRTNQPRRSPESGADRAAAFATGGQSLSKRAPQDETVAGTPADDPALIPRWT
jgi:hypothetical protein